MNKKKVYGILIISALFLVLCFAGTASAKTWKVDDGGGTDVDFVMIQDAVNAASPGDTVFVHSGTYIENVDVDKTLTLVGEDCATTVIDGSGGNVIDILANNVEIRGFTIRNGWSGIYISGYNGNVITNNIISQNIGTGVGDGIYIRVSHGNIVSENTITGNAEDGLTLADASDNTVSRNTITSNGCIGLFIHASADRNRIYNNIISLNGLDGVYIGDADENTILKNTIASHSRVGISLSESHENRINLNNFIDNTDNFRSYNSNNVWNSPEPITYQYHGATFTNKMGNHWSDYTGTDTNNDGIGDVPYSIDTDEDNYPLIDHIEDYIILTGLPELTFSQHALPSSNVAIGTQNVLVNTLDFSATGEGIKVDAIKVTLYGCGSKTDLSDVKIYKETSGYGFYPVADTDISNSETADAWNDGVCTVTLGTGGSNGPQTIEEGDATWYIVFDIASTATEGHTVGGRIASGADISAKVDGETIVAQKEGDDPTELRTIIAPPLADLTLSLEDITFSPSDPKSGDDVTISFKIKNEGTAVSLPCKVQLSQQAAPHGLIGWGCSCPGLVDVDSLAVGETSKSLQKTWKWGVTRGWHEVRFRLDIDEVVDEGETGEGNNVVNKLIEIGCEYCDTEDSDHTPVFTDPKKALILVPYEDEDIVGYSKGLKDKLEDAGWSVTMACNDEVTVENFDAWLDQDFAIIHITTHGFEGGFVLEHFEKKGPRDVRWEALADDENYGEDIEGMLFKNMPPSGGVYTIDIKADFIRKRCSSLEHNPLVYLESCDAGGSGDLKEAFVSKGAGSYVGFSAKVYECSARHVSERFYINALDKAYSIRKAIDESPRPCSESWLPCFVCDTYADWVADGNPDNFHLSKIPGDYIEFGLRCPADLTVEDPDGFEISKDSNEIPGATYLEADTDDDGDHEDMLFIPNRKTGDYTITVIPEPDAEDTDTYTLEVTAGDTTLVLAEDVPIADIPAQPYVIESTGTTINAVPVADSNGPYAGNEGSSITFDASGSYDPDGSIVLYEWDFDSDGVYDVSSATSTAFFTWGDDHTGTVELRVTDNDGLGGIDTATIKVNNVAPTASFYVEQPEEFILPYHSLTFNDGSTDAGWMDTHAATWDFGDGTIVSGTLTPIGTTTAEHTYSEPGTYTVTLTVTDDDGGVGDYAAEVTVISAEEAAGIIIDQLEVSIVPVDAPKGVSQKIESAIDKLDQVIDFLDQGKYCDAIGKLDGMITQIEGAIDQVNEQKCSVKECKGKECICIADEDADELIESLEHAKQGAIAIRDFISAEHPECA